MELFTNLSLRMKAMLATLSAICLFGAAFLFDSQALPFLMVGTLVVLLVLVGYLVGLRVLKRRRAEAMGGRLSRHSATAPRGVSDPARRARLDDLRVSFQKGLAKFRAAGKDLYSLPWYLVVGEAGSGKTETIRNCEVGFPSGLQDRLQGAGGTLNMHWWFTNHAVMIDTAGRLMFEEAPPGATSEWGEFLQLLRRSRPNCPINGLLLVVPADSLIRDTNEEVAEKAARIAEQLSTIQSRLDVRFPVFICVTKCDLIHGFREFFNGVDDPHLQHQMLGWSNPDPLDQPFRPELTEQHFETVIERLRRRRLGLLQDPTPQETEGGSRLDEVDAMFSLPSSLAQLAPRLQRYLEAIFGKSEWSAQPLFLRGIYFASARREGSALDLELAEAIGVPLESLPEGRAWERERPYFLRDLFAEKIFKERGLVTQASNTRRLLWQRRVLLLGGGMASLLMILGFSWLGARALRDRIGREAELWLAAKGGWEQELWRPIIAPAAQGGSGYRYQGDQRVRVGKAEMSLAEFHRVLAEAVQSDLRVPRIFGPVKVFSASTNANRRRAQRVLFENSVVLPLIRAAREEMVQARAPWTAASAEALAYLVRLENQILNASDGIADKTAAPAFLATLGGFVWGESKPDIDLVMAFDLLYLKRKDANVVWPPAWLSAGGTLTMNAPIGAGLNRLQADLEEKQATQNSGLERLRQLRDELRGLRHAEDELVRLASLSTVSDADFARDIESALQGVLRYKGAVDRLLPGLAPVNGAGEARLFTVYQKSMEQSKTEAERALRLLKDELERFPPASRASVSTLGTDVRRAVIKLQQDLKASTDGQFATEELNEMQALDTHFLVPVAGEVPLLARCAAYQALAGQLRQDILRSDAVLGTLGQRVARLKDELKGIAEWGRLYQGPVQTEFGHVVRRTAEFAEGRRTLALFTRGMEEIEASLEGKVGFPLVLGATGMPMTVASVREIASVLQLARGDVAAMRQASPPPGLTARLGSLEQRVARIGAVTEALLADDRGVADVSITLLRLEEQIPRLAMQQGNERWREWFWGDYWSLFRLGGKVVNTSESRNLEVGRMSAASGDLRIDLFRYPDDISRNRIDVTIDLNGAWALMTLLQQPTTRRLSGGREWEVMLSQSDASGRRRHLVLVLRFDRPLPDLEQWPSARRMGLLATDTKSL